MNVLALEPYYGGSHKAFLDGWIAGSCHAWTVLGLPPHKWKWRMRHGAITLAQQVGDLVAQGCRWDVLFCSDMLNLAEFRGLAPTCVRDLPCVAYFHENQLTYPVRHEDERDYHYVMSNITTALAADAVWFNTAYHRDTFLDALTPFLQKMPDQQPFEVIDRIRGKACTRAPGINPLPPRPTRTPGPLRICWAARWEHDKNPEAFFDAVYTLVEADVPFVIDVIGQQFRDQPDVFGVARRRLEGHIGRWGYQPTRQDYVHALLDADVIVSTADHEYFGISVVEAIAAGAYPLLPRRLAYPEILAEVNDADRFLYDGSVDDLAARLDMLAKHATTDRLWQGDPTRVAKTMDRFTWPHLRGQYDHALTDLVRPEHHTTETQ